MDTEPEKDETLIEDLFGQLALISLEHEEDVEEPNRNLLLEAFKERLENNPYFFMKWFGIGSSDDDTASCHFNEEQAESFMKIFYDMNLVVPRTKKQLKERVFRPSKSFEDIVGFFVEAFVIAGTNKRSASKAFQLCKTVESYAVELVGQGMSPEYLPGVKYLVRWGQLHATLCKGKLPPNADPDSYDGEMEFQNLCDKSKGLVLGAKCSFISVWRKISTTRYETLSILLEMIKLDPTCYEWHYHLGNWLRHARRRSGTLSMVSPEEEKALWDTYENCDYVKFQDGKNSRLRNKALAGILQGLAENLKYRKRNRMFGPFKFGGFEFRTDGEAAEFVVQDIKRMIREEKEMNGQVSFSELIRMGEMLSSLLPEEYRDLKAAEKYYLEALALKSRNSKLHHKLGILYLTSPDREMQSIPKSLKHLRIAWELEHSNIPSGIDLMKTLMTNVTGYSDEIYELMNTLLSSNRITENDRRQIFFAKACVHYLLGERDDAVKLWMKSDIDSQRHGDNIMYTLGGAVRRYRWDADKFQFLDILHAIEAYETSHGSDLSPEELQSLERMKTSSMLRIRRYNDQGRNDQAGPPRDLGIFRGGFRNNTRGGNQWRGRGGGGWNDRWRDNNPERERAEPDEGNWRRRADTPENKVQG